MCGKIISIDKSYIPHPYKEREGRGEETFVEFHNACRKKDGCTHHLWCQP